MKYRTIAITLAMLTWALIPAARADQTEQCAVKAIQNGAKAEQTVIKAAQKVCKSLDAGGLAAFDDPPFGDDNNTIEETELDETDFDFEKLTEKVNKYLAKGAGLLADGGAPCEAHFSNPTTLDPDTQVKIMADVADLLSEFCR